MTKIHCLTKVSVSGVCGISVRTRDTSVRSPFLSDETSQPSLHDPLGSSFWDLPKELRHYGFDSDFLLGPFSLFSLNVRLFYHTSFYGRMLSRTNTFEPFYRIEKTWGQRNRHFDSLVIPGASQFGSKPVSLLQDSWMIRSGTRPRSP